MLNYFNYISKKRATLNWLEKVLLTIFIVTCFLTLFGKTQMLSEIEAISKWHLFAFSFSLATCLLSIYKINNPLSKINQKTVIYYISIIITDFSCILALHGLLQAMEVVPCSRYFIITGTFENPVGLVASLCASIPFIVYSIRKAKFLPLKYSNISILLIVVICISISGSRTAILTMGVIGIIIIHQLRKICFSKKSIILFATGLIILTGGLYFLRKDSADGRLLVWKCSWDMFMDKPFAGHGIGGFQANYMNYQAIYFENHPDSKYSRLSDNVNYPFNEYLGLLINYGLVGCLIVFSVFLILWNLCKWNRCDETQTATLCLTSIGLLALFSYPLSYIFIWCMLLLSISIILFFANNTITLQVLRWKKLLYSLGVVLSTVVLLYSGTKLFVQYSWGQVAKASLKEQTASTFAKYKDLFPLLKDNKYFLYNYAVELNYGKRYKESIQIAQLCEKLWADYNLQLLLGDNYNQLKRYKEAEKHIMLAANMCPTRFIPLYELFKIYKNTNNKEKSIRMAKTILKKPIKINSLQVQYIIADIKLYLSLKD